MRACVWLLATLVVLLAMPVAAGDDVLGSVLASPAPRNRVVVRRWTVADGLAADTLIDVSQAADGRIWITSFNGLMRFDGLRFEHFDKRAIEARAGSATALGLTSNGSHQVLQHPDGQLLIATQGSGVLVFENGRFRSLHGADELRRTVRSLFVDRRGGLWFGVNDFGAHRFVGGRVVPVESPGLGGVTVFDILEDVDGGIWFATDGKGVTHLRDGTSVSWTAADGLASDAAQSLELNASGLWVGTADGLSLLADGSVRRFPETDGLEINDLETIGGFLWIGAQQGLHRLDLASGTLERPLEFEGRPFGPVSRLLVDREGSLWLAGYGGGLFQVKPVKFTSYSRRDGISSDRVSFACALPDERVLVGAETGVVHVIHDGRVRRFPISTRLPEVRVRHAFEDSSGTLWFSTYAGLLEMRPGSERLWTVARGLPTDQIRLVYEDSRGRLWVGTRNAGLLRRLEGDRWQVLDKESGLTSNFVLSVEEGPGGDLLVGTYEGLDLVDEDRVKASHTRETGLPGAVVFNTTVDHEGAVWVATNGGLARLRQGRLDAVTVDQGLPTDTVFDYQEDGLGFVWLSSELGMVRIDKSRLSAVLDGAADRLEATVYDEQDGLAHRQCTGATGLLKAADGRLWVPTLGGVSVIDPARLGINPVVPPVAIDRIEVDGDRRQALAGSEEILPAGTRELVIEFAVAGLMAPEKLQVRYILEGFDDGWREAGTDRRVRYTNLPPGGYTFRVKAANEDGLWNEPGAGIGLRVRPHIYERPEVIAAVLLVLGGAVVAAVSARMKTIHERNAMLRRLVADLERRNDEIRRFTYAISHELKSPLITIQGFVGLVRNDLENADGERAAADLEPIEQATSTMARQLERLLEMMRSGRELREVELCDLGELAREAADRVRGAVAAAGAVLEVAPAMPAVRVDRDRIVAVLQGLFENSVKFAAAGREPRIEVAYDSGRGAFFVRDNGLGIHPGYHEKVFELFEKLDPRAAGQGIGLPIVRRIVELHGGRIWVESAGAGRGSTFYFTLPLG